MKPEKISGSLGQEAMRIKVCGMKHNPEAVAALGVDYLGFIFWKGSSRFMGTPEKLLMLPPASASEEHAEAAIAKVPELVGVFVDADQETIMDALEKYPLGYLQLHGQESPAYCRELQEKLAQRTSATPSVSVSGESWQDGNTKIIKAFAIGNSFNFEDLRPYLDCCDFFLFDSRGPLPGGNGTRFNWNLLEQYPFEKPFFLSGGIGPQHLDEILHYAKSAAARFCFAIDVNSGFETRPGEKNVGALRTFIKELRTIKKTKA